MKIHLGVIQTSDCDACRACCSFDARYQDYAPCFTNEQRERVLAEFPNEDISFVPVGALFRIVLRPLPGGARCVCPLLDQSSVRCRVYGYGLFDCDLWPYQVQKRGHGQAFTIATDCPAVTEERMPALLERGAELLAFARNEAARHPERLIPDYEGVIEIASLHGDGPRPSANVPRTVDAPAAQQPG